MLNNVIVFNRSAGFWFVAPRNGAGIIVLSNRLHMVSCRVPSDPDFAPPARFGKVDAIFICEEV
jgi:hypothetical protein